MRPAGSGEYARFFPEAGHFACRSCGRPVFSAAAKSPRQFSGEGGSSGSVLVRTESFALRPISNTASRVFDILDSRKHRGGRRLVGLIESGAC